jgi:hypothetical protein
MRDASISDSQCVDRLASRLNLLCRKRIDPETFHVEKDAIVVEMRAVARRLRGNVRRQPSTTWRPPYDV